MNPKVKSALVMIGYGLVAAFLYDLGKTQYNKAKTSLPVTTTPAPAAAAPKTA